MEEILRAHNQSVGNKNPKRKKRIKIVIWLLVFAVLGVVGWIAATGAIAIRNITSANTSERPSFLQDGSIAPDQLKKEGQTRINVLAIGLAEQGGTDTIQVVSIDPINNTMSMISLPRDLYVKSPTGYMSKINAIYLGSSKYCPTETNNCNPRIDYGAKALKSVVETVLGIDVHYFAKVDFMGLVKIVDAVGGVTVTTEKSLSDSQYPCSDNPSKACGYYLSAGTHDLDGSGALKYVRCRKGTCDNDFGRSKRQQEVMGQLTKKLISVGVLSNPKKITDIISIAGSHLRTDLSLSEMSKLLELVTKSSSQDGTNYVLDNNAETGLLKAYTLGTYYLAPKLGLTNYSAIHEKVISIMPEPYIIKEGAKITIVNATGNSDSGISLKKTLTNAGYVVVSNIEAAEIENNTTVSKNNDMPYTVSLLKLRLNATGVSATITPQSDITITLGTDYLKDE
ncbi:LCP family protein [Candidatus Berkelbacteria bacterium]|nr:LCP family protein [Candidatus Berkelbacteria bacterium]